MGQAFSSSNIASKLIHYRRSFTTRIFEVIMMRLFAVLALVLLCGFASCEGETVANAAVEGVKPIADDVPLESSDEEEADVEDEPEDENEEDDKEDEDEDDEDEAEDEDEDEDENETEDESEKAEKEKDDIYIYNFQNSDGKNKPKAPGKPGK